MFHFFQVFFYIHAFLIFLKGKQYSCTQKFNDKPELKLFSVYGNKVTVNMRIFTMFSWIVKDVIIKHRKHHGEMKLNDRVLPILGKI